jgi:hypothetical protein
MGELLVERRWRWLGHVLRMGPERLPRKCLVVGDVLAAEGARRGRVGQRLSWLRLVVKESWGHLPWGSAVLPERKPHWVRWKAGEWLPLLERVAADRQAWGRLVGCVARSFSSSALDGRGGGRV